MMKLTVILLAYS